MTMTMQSTQLSMAVLLIVSSIAIACYQVVNIHDVANGVLMYIAQAFMLAGSIFGIDYYIKKMTHGKDNSTRN